MRQQYQRGAGTVTSIHEQKGFGFIRLDNGGSLFFHACSLTPGVLEWGPHLMEMDVTFEIEPQPDGRERARFVRPAR